MKEIKVSYLVILALCFGLSGCVVRTYQTTRERLDQDLTAGNRGYLKGQMPVALEPKEKKLTRNVQVVEIELHSPIKFEKQPKTRAPEKVEELKSDQTISGNRGFVIESNITETGQPIPSVQSYRVQRGDTLQKISQKFYGTTKKWTKLYEANKDKIKSQNKIYPGQVIDIPLEPLKETKENLK